MSEEDLRARAAELVRKAEQDSEFAAKAKSDPIGALEEAGVTASDMKDAMTKALPPFFSCNDFTCFTSGCPGTCFVTFCHSTRRRFEEPMLDQS